MKTSQLIQKFKDEGILTGQQWSALEDINSNRRFSLHTELRAVLYAGVLSLATGVGLILKTYFQHLGSIAIISTLSILCAGAFVYCWRKGGGFSCGEVKSPNLAFDYVLLMGCLMYSLDVAYIETHFRLLGLFWKNHLLFSAVLFGFLSYRFDNRLVLSLALSTLAAWFGFKLSDLHFFSAESFRVSAIIYGSTVFLAGELLRRASIKKHFTGIYYNFAANFLFISLLSGVIQHGAFSIFSLGLVILCGITAMYALKSHKFLYLLYAIIYGYIGASSMILKNIHFEGFIFLYLIVSSLSVVGLIVFLSHKFRNAA